MTSIRTALFVPGSRPDRFAKALATDADGLIVDFEDAVEPSQKAQARHNLAEFLRTSEASRVMVRINARETDYYDDDVKFCEDHPQLRAVVIPKAEEPQDIELLTGLGHKVWALIETAKGIHAAPRIAEVSGVERLTFGALDLAGSLGLNPTTSNINLIFDQVRFALLLASAANGLEPPLDTIFPDIGNLNGFDEFIAHGKDMGMGGMLCIHPNQVNAVNVAYGITLEERLWAERVLKAAIDQPAAFQLEGAMVDAPVIKRAQRLLEAAK